MTTDQECRQAKREQGGTGRAPDPVDQGAEDPVHLLAAREERVAAVRRGLWARQTVAAALALGAAAAWMSACGDDPAGIAGGGEPASLSVTPVLAEPVAVGDELVLAAEVRDAGGRIVADAAVSWTSSDPRVATVGPEGTVTAVGPGTATIMAASGGASGTVQFSVADPAYAVLAALALMTDIENWHNSEGWGESYDLGTWYGVSQRRGSGRRPRSRGQQPDGEDSAGPGRSGAPRATGSLVQQLEGEHSARTRQARQPGITLSAQ